MPADNVLAEALARVEHKVDLLLGDLLRLHHIIKCPQLGAIVTCPVCDQKVEYQVDQINKVIVRKCGCKTGLQAPLDLNAFAPPAPARKDQDHGGDEQEDRGNPDSGRRPGGR
jgi:hypothetical protein